MQKNIIRRDYQPDDAARFAALHPLLQRIYAARGVPSTNELDLSLQALLPAQSLLGLDAAVSILADAVMQRQKIMIVGDFDADGATSTALSVRALRSFGAEHVEFLVPNRFAFGYGLTKELVAVAKISQPAVIMTVDNGIANHAGVDAARAEGIRVVITDHHLAAGTLPAADAIVNPNQPHDPFPSKNLAGVGVAFYVMLALRRHLERVGWFEKKRIPQPNMSQFLDLVALGTVADLVALDYNNRILVHQGLRRIRAGQCSPGIVALLELADRDFTRIRAADLGFAVGARLNAAGRLDDMSLGIECLLSDDAVAARAIAKRLDALNLERRHIEQDMQAQAFDVLRQLTTRLQGDLPRGLCLFDETWHQGVIGILASRIKERFHRPVIVFAPGQAGEVKGSARSIAGLHIRDVLALIDATHPHLIQKFGGHAMAAGLTMQQIHLNEFISVFDQVVATQVSDAQLQHVVFSDGELQSQDVTLEVAIMLREAGPFGQAFAEPLFDGVFSIVEQRLVGDKHLKLRLMHQGQLLDAIAFFIDTNEWPNHRCASIRAAYRLDVNEYKGRSSVQLIIDYLEPVFDQQVSIE